MSPTPAVVPAANMPTWVDGILSALLMGAGGVLVTRHILSSLQLAQAVAAILVLVSITWAAINADPNKKSPIAFLLALVAQAPAANQAAYDAALTQAEAAAELQANAVIAAQAAKIPLLGRVIAHAGDQAAAQLIDAEGAKLLEPLPQPQPRSQP